METVRVIYHHEAAGWWAESPDVEGWSAAGDSYAISPLVSTASRILSLLR